MKRLPIRFSLRSLLVVSFSLAVLIALNLRPRPLFIWYGHSDSAHHLMDEYGWPWTCAYFLPMTRPADDVAVDSAAARSQEMKEYYVETRPLIGNVLTATFIATAVLLISSKLTSRTAGLAASSRREFESDREEVSS